jgi:hypothetical protein
VFGSVLAKNGVKVFLDLDVFDNRLYNQIALARLGKVLQVLVGVLWACAFGVLD